MSSWISELLNSLGFQISTVVVLFGALCLYFGRIISFPKLSKIDRSDTYIQGLLFVISFILIPLLFNAIFIIIPVSFNPIIFGILLFIPIIIILCMTLSSFYVFRDRISFLEHISMLERTPLNRENFYLNPYFLQITSWVTVTICGFYIISTYFDTNVVGIIEFGLIAIGVVIAFCICTIIAMFYGYSLMRYPIMDIYFEIGNNSKNIERITGRIIEGKEYFIIVSDNERHYIKRDRVIRIDETQTSEEEE